VTSSFLLDDDVGFYHDVTSAAIPFHFSAGLPDCAIRNTIRLSSGKV
jgi:hypothetical protein